VGGTVPGPEMEMIPVWLEQREAEREWSDG
jgi:hypothetical protein